jgi:hypothetical protein
MTKDHSFKQRHNLERQTCCEFLVYWYLREKYRHFLNASVFWKDSKPLLQVINNDRLAALTQDLNRELGIQPRRTDGGEACPLIRNK